MLKIGGYQKLIEANYIEGMRFYENKRCCKNENQNLLFIIENTDRHFKNQLGALKKTLGALKKTLGAPSRCLKPKRDHEDISTIKKTSIT